MTNDQAIKLKKRAMYSATRYGFKRDREEISQEVLCRMLESPDRGATVDQITIDVIRERYGRPGTPGFDGKHSLAKSLSAGDGLENLERTAAISNGITLDDRLDFDRVGAFLNGEERAISLLVWFWGMNEIEVAHIFGVSPSRICQRLTRISERLSKRAEKEAGSSRERTSEMAEVGRETTQGMESKENFRMEAEEPRPMEANNGPRFQAWLT